MSHRLLPSLGALLAAVALAACGDSGTSPAPTAPPVTEPSPAPEPPAPAPTPPGNPGEPTCEDQSFESTFDAVQQVIFDRYGCVGCHSGETPQGGLDLSPDVAYDNLVEVDSVGSNLSRIYPGARERSSLWLKVYANVDPSVTSLSPMPPSGPVPTEDELELLRLWILGGAPREGTVLGTEELLPGCLADPTPISIIPLEPPPAEEGVQFVMPGFDLVASSETEVCFATYYDFTDQIPDEFKSEDGSAFFYDGYEVRQDALSHHLIFFRGEHVDGTPLEPEDLSGWTCADGDVDGSPCDPRDADACGTGYCRTPVQSSLACIGYQTSDEDAFFPSEELAVQQAQSTQNLYPGTFRELPIRGVVLWNSHAFNLTTEDHLLRGRINLRFATDRRHTQQRAGGFDTAFGIPTLLFEGAPPYTEDVMCEHMVLPQGTRITGISSHTHRQGKHFWYELPSGEHIYDSFIYNDPLNYFPEEPLAFDDPDPAQRTLKYCALFRNGVDEDGNPLPEEVTRASRIEYAIPLFPGSTFGFCEPTHCVNEGQYHVECDDGIDDNRAGDDAACDSSPGAGDGVCDACPITGGVTTENEMFGALIWYFITDGYPDDVPVEFPDASSFNLFGGDDDDG